MWYFIRSLPSLGCIILTFEALDGTKARQFTRQRQLEQYFPVEVYYSVDDCYKVGPYMMYPFKCKMLSNFFCGAIYYAVQGDSKVRVCG